jgi:hypothetical protein
MEQRMKQSCWVRFVQCGLALGESAYSCTGVLFSKEQGLLSRRDEEVRTPGDQDAQHPPGIDQGEDID